METLEERLVVVEEILKTRRFRFTEEAELQEGIHLALTEMGLSFTREVSLTPRDRIDLLEDGKHLVGGAIGIEVKIAGTLGALSRQVERYAEHDRVGAVILVTSKMQHTAIGNTTTANGKLFRVVYVGGARL